MSNCLIFKLLAMCTNHIYEPSNHRYCMSDSYVLAYKGSSSMEPSAMKTNPPCWVNWGENDTMRSSCCPVTRKIPAQRILKPLVCSILRSLIRYELKPLVKAAAECGQSFMGDGGRLVRENNGDACHHSNSVGPLQRASRCSM